jgi:hypothetical protein
MVLILILSLIRASSGLTHKPRAPIGLQVKRLEEYHLLRRHLGEVPLVLWRVTHDVVLARAFAIAEVELEEVVWRRGCDVAHGERALLHDVQRFPNVDEGDAAGKEIFCFITEELAHAEGARFSSIVAVDEHDWGALRRVGLLRELLGLVLLRADGMVKDEHAFGADGFLQELDNLRIEVCPGRLFIFPLVEPSLEVVQRKPFLVKRKLLRSMLTIKERNLVRVIPGLMNRPGSSRLVEVQLRELRTKILGVV